MSWRQTHKARVATKRSLGMTEPRRLAISRSEIAMVECACALLNEPKREYEKARAKKLSLFVKGFHIRQFLARAILISCGKYGCYNQMHSCRA